MVDALGFDTATKRGGYLEHLTEHNLAAKYKIRGEDVYKRQPTDPISVIIGGKGSTPEIIENAREKFHLNEPVWKQYLIWISGILHGDWGTSYKFQTPVLETIAARAPITAGLVIGASVISLIVSIPLGVDVYKRQLLYR